MEIRERHVPEYEVLLLPPSRHSAGTQSAVRSISAIALEFRNMFACYSCGLVQDDGPMVDVGRDLMDF